MRAACAPLLLLLAAPAWADAPADLARAQARLAEAAQTLQNAGAETRLLALTQAVTAQEAVLAALHAGLRGMAAAEGAALAAITADQGRLGGLVAALQSLSRAPRSALLAFPGGPVRAARAASLMSAVAPELDARMVDLQVRLEALRALRADQEAARIEARGALANLQDLRARASGAAQQGDGPRRSDLIDAAEAARRQAGDLASLARGLGPDGAVPVPRFAETTLGLPVQGTVTARFGQPDPWGRPGAGWTVVAPAYAQVTAPVDATVRFAGPLIDYGAVMVLEPESPYLIVLAGMAHLDRLVGESVLAGERLGDLGGPLPSSDEFLYPAGAETGQLGVKTLYIEIRHGGNPVDPAAWFAAPDPTRQ